VQRAQTNDLVECLISVMHHIIHCHPSVPDVIAAFSGVLRLSKLGRGGSGIHMVRVYGLRSESDDGGSAATWGRVDEGKRRAQEERRAAAAVKKLEKKKAVRDHHKHGTFRLDSAPAEEDGEDEEQEEEQEEGQQEEEEEEQEGGAIATPLGRSRSSNLPADIARPVFAAPPSASAGDKEQLPKLKRRRSDGEQARVRRLHARLLLL